MCNFVILLSLHGNKIILFDSLIIIIFIIVLHIIIWKQKNFILFDYNYLSCGNKIFIDFIIIAPFGNKIILLTML